MNRVLAFLIAVTGTGCNFIIPPGDPGIVLYAWNRSQDEYVVRVGDEVSDECFALPPAALGEFYSTLGDIDEGGTRPLGLHDRDGRQVTPLRATKQTAVFVVDADARVSEVELRFSGFGQNSLIVDMPEFPELDGKELPGDLPRTDDACQALEPSN